MSVSLPRNGGTSIIGNMWPLQLAVALAYGITGWLGLNIPLSDGNITLFWLPTGIAVAAFYRYSWTLWPGVFLAALIVSLSTGLPWLNSGLIALGNTLAPLLTCYLLRRTDSNITRLTPRDSIGFLLFSALGMIVSAATGSLSLLLLGREVFSVAQGFLNWWMGDSLGVFLAAPLLVNFSLGECRRALAQPRELILIILASLVVAALCFPLNNLTSHSPAGVIHLPILFTSFICMAWAGLRFGLPGASLSTLGFGLVALVSTIQGLGPLSFDSTQLSAWMIWIYGFCMTLLGLMITSAHTQLRTASHQLDETSHEQAQQKKHLEAIIHAIPDLLIETNREGHCLWANGPTHWHGLHSHELPGRELRELLPSDAWQTWSQAIHEADDWGISQGKSIHLIQGTQSLWYELSIAKSSGQRPHEDRFVCLVRDITKRVNIYQADLANEQRFRNIFEATRNIAVQGYNRYHEVIFWNKASEDLYGFSAQEAMGQKLEHLIIPPFMRNDVFNAIENWHLHNQAIPSGELPLHNAKGEEVWVYSNHVMINTLDNKEMYCLDIDLSTQRDALQQLEQELMERRQIEGALRQSERLLESAQIMARLAYWEWDPQDDSYKFSRSMVELFGLPAAQLTGQLKPFLAGCMPAGQRRHFIQSLSTSLEHKTPIATEINLLLHGHPYWFAVQGNIDEHADGTLCMRGTLQDITERKRLDAALAAAAADTASTADFFETMLRALAEALEVEHVLISLLNPDDPAQASTHTYIKYGQLQENFDYSLNGTPCANVVDENLCFITTGAKIQYPDDHLFQLSNIDSYLGVGIRNPQGQHVGILIVMSEKALNVSPQVRSLLLIFAERISGELNRASDQEQIYRLAFFDPLTRLPNRRMLMDRLRLIIAQSARTSQQGALLFIDLDHFKLLNDTRGHHIGDQLLVQVAERISSIIRTTDLAARLGGDEFVVVFDNLGTDPDKAALEAKHRAEQLHELINLPYPLQQSVYHCTISIGVNLFNANNTSIDDLLRHADVAMYQAKDGGRNTIRFFDPHMQSRLEKRAEIEADLRSAHESGTQLTPYYQAQVNHTGEVLGAELLLRWIHPRKGTIAPGDFIPVAEQTGLIVAIGRQVIRMACKQLQCWQQQPGFGHLTLAVNVSPIQFNQSSFVEDVISCVLDYDVNPNHLKLELTESSLLKNVEHSIEKMQRLQEFGISFAMDDFGIGYSSLSYLKKLPLDQLKIDRTFVRDITIDPNDAIIVRTIIAMAANMNLNVIAEGVETELQKQFLEQNGCLLFQGYYFGKPMPLDAFEELIHMPQQLIRHSMSD
ncbi:bifunctional diguanylate cyclase/phosphodiesterase [Cellvibrio japonicus]|uniref:Sensory box protein n=1 Tax=Cellvibrio japonicus (strain Ueda107) TaxID=498211 RepID=B3PC21_CELJU|nr:EAL domain-containing protein [Cellvibrio japonicus]ACE83823.1 sensory box protein [Cellvibrio japonicus Ueda107]QEI13173.1 EAL domain-containing protein [Cellvibrio japonicus]QEI16747.1 EAL domain-containing protein [Cellvibrio japonicus]QEI20325.1 EAL domain-containing protein [Cellvibrio japonicus]